MTLVERRLGVAQASLIVAEEQAAAGRQNLEQERRARAAERAAAEARIRELGERLRRQQS